MADHNKYAGGLSKETKEEKKLNEKAVDKIESKPLKKILNKSDNEERWPDHHQR